MRASSLRSQARRRPQINLFGVQSGGHLGNQVAEQIGGSWISGDHCVADRNGQAITVMA